MRKIDPLLRYAFSINASDSFLHVLPADLSSKPYVIKSWTTWEAAMTLSRVSKIGVNLAPNLESPSFGSASKLCYSYRVATHLHDERRHEQPRLGVREAFIPSLHSLHYPSNNIQATYNKLSIVAQQS